MKKTTPRLRPGQRVLIALLAVFTALPFIGVSIADASPGLVPAQVKINKSNVQVSIGNGSLAVENGKLVFRNSAGTVLERTPLSYIGTDNRTYPIDASVKGRTATLTPSKEYARSTATSADLLAKTDVASKRRQRDDEALARLNQEINAGITISSLIGTGIGVVLGAVFGCLGGAILGLAVGCIPGAIMGAGIGGILGTVIGGGGSAIVAVFRYFETINSPVR